MPPTPYAISTYAPEPAVPRQGGTRRDAAIAAAVMVALFYAAALPLMLTGVNRGSSAADQAQYHLPTIQQFAAQWPHVDFHDYPSATTPLYHLLMAAVYRAAHGDVRAVQLVSSLFTAGMLATLAAAVARRVGWLRGIALCLPFACSMHVFTPGVWLVPHAPAWWAILGILLLCLRPRVDSLTYVVGGALLLVLVLTRQIHLWAALPLLAAAWTGDAANPGGLSRPLRVFAMVIAVLPAFGAVAYFVHLWHGMTPPQQTWVNLAPSGNFAAIPMILALCFCLGVFFAGWLPTRIITPPGCTQLEAHVPEIGLFLAALASILPQTDFNRTAGRWSGLWNVAQRLPVFAHRSPMIILLGILGGIIVTASLWALRLRDRLIVGATLIGFAAAHVAIGQAWQRYYEPLLLMLFPLLVIRIDTAKGARPRAFAIVGPLILAVVLAAVTIVMPGT